MSFIVPDQVSTVAMEERNGVVRSLTRRARIFELTSIATPDVLLEAYMLAGLPAPGSYLHNPPLSLTAAQHPGSQYGLSMLVLADRKFTLVDQDKRTVDVDMTYQHFMEGDNQNLGGNLTSALAVSQGPNDWTVPFARNVYGKNRASVQQTKTNFYDSRVDVPLFDPFGTYPLGSIVDYNGVFWVNVSPVAWGGLPTAPLAPPPGPAGTLIGTIWDIQPEETIFPTLAAPGRRRQIVVGHQFPTTDPANPGQVKYQTGEITQMQPNDNFKLHGQVFIRNPRAIKRALLRAINSVPWMDGDAYEWMCTEITWEPLYVEWQWRVSFEFQHNPDTWIPNAIFHDQRFGKPPPGVVSGFGVRSIHTQPEVDFDNYFGNILGCIPSTGA